jgi:lincosamide nucleotidyltransferase
MNLTEYNQFTEELRLKLAGDDRVLALIAVGSMAQQDYQPDEWSDHDFFVITIHGVQEDMRRDLSWLPRPDALVFSFRETEHGMKALYAGGHLLEFAIFNKDELQMARINRYRCCWTKRKSPPGWLSWP